MKFAPLEKSLSLRGISIIAVVAMSLAAVGCANRNSCMPNGTYGPYNGYPYAGQPGQQPVYPSQMVGTPMNPGSVMPGQPSTFAAPPGYPTGTPYPQAGYGPPPGGQVMPGAQGMPGGQPYLGR